LGALAVILIADDSDEIRALYGAALRHRGHEVHEASDGRMAIEVALRLHPDLVLLDVWMPHANGFEVLDALAGDAASGRTRIVMLSVLDDGDTRLEAFGGGAVDYLIKGVSLSELMERIDAILSHYPACEGSEEDENPGRSQAAKP
jgi:two-component system response regulator AdeR